MSVVDFDVLSLGHMTTLFVFSSMLLDFIELNLDLDLYLNQISLDLALKLMKPY